MKSKTYTITEDQIKDIFYFIEIEEHAEKIKEWFPEAFEVNILEHLSKDAINKFGGKSMMPNELKSFR